MNVKTMLEYADAHGQAIRDSNESHAQADLSPDFRDRANAIATTLPHPVTAYEVVSVSVSDGVGTVRIRYAGAGSSRTIESDWEVRGGRPILFDARPVD